VITVVIPVSPIKSHPETFVLEETVESIRHHLPTAEIILTFDGVRPEHEHRRQAYEHAIYNTLAKARAWKPVAPFIFEEHRHQVGMLRAVIDEIRTPLLMYVEADTPLVTDETIDVDCVANFITDGHSNLVRLHHEGVIPAEHQHMMHGDDWPNLPEDIAETCPELYSDIKMVRTSQWSQRPHVASVAFYRRVLDSFTPNAKAFIEDHMHGVVDQAYRIDGILGWDQWRLHIYHPTSGNIKRSYHLDGRAGEPKLDGTQVF